MAKMTENERYESIVGRQPRREVSVLSVIALLLIMAGTLIPLFMARTTAFDRMQPLFKYIFTAGAVLSLAMRFFSPYTGTVMRVKRLYRIQAWSSIFFCVGAFFLFYEPNTTRDWLAFTMAGAVIQLYASIMLPSAINKALKEGFNDEAKK